MRSGVDHSMRTRLAILIIAALAGCSTVPDYPNDKSPTSACIRGDQANLIKFFSDGEAHVFVSEIDGLPSPGGGPFCMKAGMHRFGIAARAKGYESAEDYVDVELQPSRRYQVRGNLRGTSIALRLVDVTEADETTVAEFRFSSMSQGGSGVPIFIPVKKR